MKVRTLEDVPIEHARTQYHLGIAYGILAGIKDKAENYEKAVQAYQEALKVRTLDDLPMDYAETQYNLGNVYSTLAEVKDKAENCEKAVQAYQEALSIYTKEEFSEIYRIIGENIKKCL